MLLTEIRTLEESGAESGAKFLMMMNLFEACENADH